jgi:hypothetical protein
MSTGPPIPLFGELTKALAQRAPGGGSQFEHRLGLMRPRQPACRAFDLRPVRYLLPGRALLPQWGQKKDVTLIIESP